LNDIVKEFWHTHDCLLRSDVKWINLA
jgi:hypothetical protein